MSFSFPFASIDSDRQITSDMERARIQAIVGDGVKQAFEGTVQNNVLTLTAGAAVVGGAFYDVDTGDSINLPDEGGRCYISLRLDSVARKVTLEASSTDTIAAESLRLGYCDYAGTAWGEIKWTYAIGVIESRSTANGKFDVYPGGCIILYLKHTVRSAAWSVTSSNVPYTVAQTANFGFEFKSSPILISARAHDQHPSSRGAFISHVKTTKSNLTFFCNSIKLDKDGDMDAFFILKGYK